MSRKSSTGRHTVDDLLDKLRSTAAFLRQCEAAAASARAPWIDQAADEIEGLRRALVTYGDRARMSNVSDMAIQQTIDRAFETRSIK